MGLFDFLKHDKKKQAEQKEQQAAARGAGAAPPTPSDMGSKYADASGAGKAAAERAAGAPKAAVPRTAAGQARPHPAPAEPSDLSAAHKAVPVPPKPPAAAKKRTYTVKAGDSLAAIARRELGNEARWRELYAMNRGVIGANPDLIQPGQVLTLPG
ncbi:LysM peptidoglycan-binding domain-containing protein [Streptomyces sp. NPDC096136]|uniref:LysM peptidoglycan-binding domain-containing protein n=1 Tax=Streptomyces sp. NPDC096136 TaxID=3366076 RepID=UPI0037FC1A9E